MILADKIMEERKKNGWSQEELADKLSVSRQAVSKWESAQSVPDLQRVIQLAEIFNVSTDYLLKDEVEAPSPMEVGDIRDEDQSLRRVSMEEANEFLTIRRKNAPMIAGGVAMCILSPVILIFLAGLADSHIGNISEGLASGIGIVAVIPLLIAGSMDTPNYICCALTSLLLVLVAIGVYLMVNAGMIKGSYDMLLQEGDFSKSEKHAKKKMELFSSAYWCLATAIYLGWSFWTNRWDFTWIVWPVVGVLYAVISAILKMVMGNKE